MRGLCALAVAAAFVAASAARAGDEPPHEDVRLRTADGLTIAATYYPAAPGTPEPAPVVVALPMYRRTRASYASIVGPVTDRGMALLTLDLRGHGDSAKQGDGDLAARVEARDPALFGAMHLDVEAAIAWLVKDKRTPKGGIGLLGASVGCSVAIDTAVRDPGGVAAVVCLTPGKNYLGVPTMDHVAKWPEGKPLLLVSSAAEMDAGAGPIGTVLDGKGAELKRVEMVDPVTTPPGPMDLHGTAMFGRVPGIEGNVADWLAFHIAFRRVDLGDGVVVLVGSVGDALYVGVETALESKVALDGLVVRVGLGPVTDPWSKSETLDAGRRLDGPSKEAPTRRRTRFRRDRIGVDAGRPFTAAVSLDGKTFLPRAADPPLVFALR